MKPFIKAILFLLCCVHYGSAQDSSVLLSAKMFATDQLIAISQHNGWLFRVGHNVSWANENLDIASWKKLKPTELSSKYADKTGKVEGWFRFKFKLDSSFNNIPLGIKRSGWAATDIYIDGNFFAAFGNTGTNGNVYKEYNPIDKLSIPVNLEPGKEHLVAVHFVDYLSPFPPYKLESGTRGGVRTETLSGLKFFIILTRAKYNSNVLNLSRETLIYRSIWLTVTLLLALLFWLLAFLNPIEKKTLFWIAIYSSLSALTNLTRFFLADQNISFITFQVNDLLQKLCYWMLIPAALIIIITILNFRISGNLKRFLFAYFFAGALTVFFDFFERFAIINTLIMFLWIFCIRVPSLKKLKGAQWAIAGGVVLSILFGTVFGIMRLFNYFHNLLFILTCFYFSFPLSLLVYISLRFREIIREVRANARQVVKLSEEKREQALNQQMILEQQVKERTAELSQSLDNLKATQKQLIQSEKMASLGELTAGIAHEIQNPLNFVNNFSDVNAELIDEADAAIEKGNIDEAKTILRDIKENEEKINQHGKRADTIVKGMLQHSRISSGQKELRDINTLCDEYLRLAFHGYRAKDKSFNSRCETNFDGNIEKISVVPQDIGRVLLNLINNAFYFVNEKAKQNIGGYEPKVIVSTKKTNGNIEITVKDNGNGIPDSIKEKIFQPFFTTKPTGQGTGLGLSLSYDIVLAHGGEIKVRAQENEGSEFIVNLPVK